MLNYLNIEPLLVCFMVDHFLGNFKTGRVCDEVKVDGNVVGAVADEAFYHLAKIPFQSLFFLNIAKDHGEIEIDGFRRRRHARIVVNKLSCGNISVILVSSRC